MFFVKETELFGKSQRRFNDDVRKEVMEYIKGASLLVIDDFGQAPLISENEVKEMRLFYEEVFDEIRKKKPVERLKVPRLILTTNLTRDETEKLPYFSERIFSRIESIASFVRFKDRDYRFLGFPDFLPSEPKL